MDLKSLFISLLVPVSECLPARGKAGDVVTEAHRQVRPVRRPATVLMYEHV